MGTDPSLEELWSSVPTGGTNERFDPQACCVLPEPTRRYLLRSIAPGTPIASAVRLRMHGEIKLKGWHTFRAEQVIYWGVGMIWQATVRMYGLTISGSDRLIDGRGAMQWNVFGMLPLVRASGPDITRSAAGRMNIESLWLPSVLVGQGVQWSVLDLCHISARFSKNGEPADISYTIADCGELREVSMARWGNLGNQPAHYIPFGGYIERSATFAGYTIPTRIRVGWYFGTEKFQSEGEFFRVTVDDVEFR